MFVSALGAITGKDNRLGLPRAKSVCVVMVDGLGSSNLRHRAGHAPRLFGSLERDGSIQAGFPSTTATSLSGFSTGNRPGKHGMIGYQIFNRSSQQNINLLNGFSSKAEAEYWQPTTTVSQLANDNSVECIFIGPAEYENSGFTFATMPSATYVAGKSMQERFNEAARILDQKKSCLIYLYIPELDMKAHQFGYKSSEWAEKLEELESEMSKFVSKLPDRAGALLTADHGIVDVDVAKHIYIDELELPGLISVAGDPRVLYLYFDAPPSAGFISELQETFGSRVLVATSQEIVDAGWFGEVDPFAFARMPDIFLVSLAETAIYHRKFAKQKSLKMIGQHGSISDSELTVPLLKFGVFANHKI